MKRLMGLALLMSMIVAPVVGCGVKELGPVDEDKIEMIPQDYIQKRMEENMKKMGEMSGGKYDPSQATGGDAPK